MAPLSQYLHFRKVLLCWLFLSAIFASSFFDFSSSVSDTQVRTTQLLLGRRNLLEKAVEDEEEEKVVVLPKKKKVKKTYTDEELLLPKKKKKSASSNDYDDEEELIPKKKKSSSSDEEVLAKKKKSTSSDEDDDVLPKKKKKFTSSDEDDDVLPKKKKLSSSDEEEDEAVLSKKKKSSSSSDNDTKLIKPKTTSTKNQTKLLKTSSNSSSSTKNQTKLINPIASSSKNKTKLTKTTTSTSKDVNNESTPSLTETKIKKLNSTSKTSDSTKSTSTTSTTKSLDPLKTTNNKSDTKKINDKSEKTAVTTTTKKKQQKPPPSWMYQDYEYDLVSEFRDLPSKFHQSFIPDLHRISTTSKVYLAKANKEITKGFKPYVGVKYAASAPTAVSFAFLVVPLLLVSLIFNRIKAYFSLQRLLIFIQIYLAIYFSILCLSSLITGLEPLRFFYATSQSTYVWLQVLQTLGYVLYLLLLLMYLVLVFSTESGLGQKLLGLAQTFVGFAIGLHYYMKVFHRVVLRQPPKTNWKIHGIYAACFLVICLLARAETRKKAYLQEGGEEGKKS